MWGRNSDKKESETAAKEAPANATKSETKQAADFDPKLYPRTKLPANLQSIVDKDEKNENFYDELVQGYVPPSTESNVRYAAYAARFRTILLSAHRYVAYTSDIGESFRPVAHPNIVRTAYGISWAYILGDVSYEGYKAYWQNQRIRNPGLQLTPRQLKATGLTNTIDSQTAGPTTPSTAAITTSQALTGAVAPLEDWRTVMVQRLLFQGIASMGLPAFTIHSVVRYSGRAMKSVKNKTVGTWGPIGLGLAVVPFLPTLFDKPVENAVEWTFHKGFAAFGGEEAVGSLPMIGREKQLSQKPGKGDKEL